MTQQEQDALAAEALDQREAQALAAYGQECDLTSGDDLIGQCTAGVVLTSPLFEQAVLDVIKRRLDVGNGEYLRREGAQIVGYPALPGGARSNGTAGVALAGTEVAVTQATINLATTGSRVALYGRVNFTKDAGTTARVVTVRLRRAGDNQLISVPCTVRSQAAPSWPPTSVHLRQGA
jgi:hypothetical protein